MDLVLVAICIVALFAAVLVKSARDRREFERHTITPGALGSAILRVLLFLLFLPEIKANADATLFIEAPINFLGHVSSTGHAALLVDDLCSDDHIHMRWCRAGEGGAVISRYKGINGCDWLAMPPGPYLFAVESSDEIPATATTAEVNNLRAEYRTNHPGSFEQGILDSTPRRVLSPADRLHSHAYDRSPGSAANAVVESQTE